MLQKFEIEKYKPKHGQTEYDYAKVISDMEKVKNGLNSDGSTSVPGVEAITNLINKTYRFLNQSTEQACTLLIQALTAANTVLDSYREGKIDGRAHAISRWSFIKQSVALVHAWRNRSHISPLISGLTGRKKWVFHWGRQLGVWSSGGQYGCTL